MKKYLPAALLIILGLATRFVPHLPNFTAIGAVAFFAGRYLPTKYSLTIPLAAMLVSDLFIGFYGIPIMLSVYLSFALMTMVGYTTQNKGWKKIATGTIVGSATFFLITNWAVWAFGTMYPSNLTGLAMSYFSAIPFFRNQLLADIFYTTVLVGGYEMIRQLTTQIQTQKSPE